MSERIFREDTVQIDHQNYVEDTDPVFGPITVFKDVVIVSEIIHPYEDGNAYKPADELEKAFWTWSNRWAISGDHPTTGIISKRIDVHGRTVNVRFVKNLKDHKTDRPNRRGILVDLQIFNKKVSPEILQDMKSGEKSDVSIGFFFTMDASPGTIEEDGHPLNGQSYDYIQRDFMGEHTAFGLDKGRCPMPYCGLTADKVMEQLTGDPFAKWKTMTACIKEIMKENPKYTKEQAAATCAEIEKKSKAKKDVFTVTLENMLTEIGVALSKLNDTEELKKDEDETIVDETMSNENSDIADVIEDCPDCEDDEEEIKRLAADLSLEDIDKKLKELKTARERLREQVRVLDEKLYSEPDSEKKRKAKIRDQRGELWDRLDDLYDEIRAYTQAKTLKITQSALADAVDPDEGEPDEVVDEIVPFDVEASQKVTERTKAKLKELSIR